MLTAMEARQRLAAGNQRYVADNLLHCSQPSAEAHRKALAAGQSPFAVVLGCADSRVPIEIVFDQGVGDLFIVRVAGNIVGSSVMGSVEFAVTHFGTALVVVLGHTRCGAVAATYRCLRQEGNGPSADICGITDRIRPAVETALAAAPALDEARLLALAVRANIAASVDRLQSGSPLLRALAARGALAVVGAEYDVETGVVAFLDVEQGRG